MSERAAAGSPRSCSGEQYPSVPSTPPLCVAGSTDAVSPYGSIATSGGPSLARPKSPRAAL
jgi:hypothetical protein